MLGAAFSSLDTKSVPEFPDAPRGGSCKRPKRLFAADWPGLSFRCQRGDRDSNVERGRDSVALAARERRNIEVRDPQSTS